MNNIIVGQSGGPTAVINASLYGVVDEALGSDKIDVVYGMINGIEGFLQGRVLNFSEYEKSHKIEMLKTTPSSFLGSCRYKLPDDIEDEVYGILFSKLNELEVKAFVYIGGNDSMDTVAKLSEYAKKHSIDICFVGVPKTVDNDLVCTDHTPGFGSIAKYVANSVREVVLDAGVYPGKTATVIELMGRHAGWITAASVLARTEKDKNPLLIYLPESAFDETSFIEDIKEAFKKQNSVVVCVSEGLADVNGRFLCEYSSGSETDAFGHKTLSGCGKVVSDIIKREIGCKCRSIELNLPQRCSALLASATDIEEAVMAGRFGTINALKHKTGVMIAFERTCDEPYEIELRTVDVKDVCNKEKKFPSKWITDNGTDISEQFVSYVIPLIQGENHVPFENGISTHLTPAYMI